MKDKWLLVGVVALVLGLGFWGGSYYYKKEASKAVAQQGTSVFVRPHSPTMGPADAPVTVVEFLDPECESCRAVYPEIKKILAENPEKIQFVVRYAPFHGNSFYAIKILEAARKQGKYWETLELLFETQPEWGSHHHPQPELIWEHLPKIGLDVEKIKSEMNDLKVFDQVELDKEDGKKLGVRGTPTFFVNGKPLRAFGLEYLKEAIEAELQGAKN